ncbi:MAG: helix-turn-helix domain-containing protein [Alphaproteobacteria bacterium]
MTTISERLRQIRIALKKTQAEMASDLGLGKATWQNYEYGVTSPNYPVLLDLAKQGFDMNWIVSGKGGMYQKSGISEGANFPTTFTTDFLQRAYEKVLKLYTEKGEVTPPKISEEIFEEVSHILQTAKTENETEVLLKHFLSRLERRVSTNPIRE